MLFYLPFSRACNIIIIDDYLHFSAPALRKFGLRYYDEFVKLEDKNKVFSERTVTDTARSTGLEHL